MIKKEYLELYRTNSENIYNQLVLLPKDKKEKTKVFNQKISMFHNGIIKELEEQYSKEANKENELEEVLLATYSFYVMMLEFRNKLWEYEYMTFSRRIGELWEPFCKLPFSHPKNELSLIKPVKFDSVIGNLVETNHNFIDTLEISEIKKQILKDNYDNILEYVNSGVVNLSLDLHFKQSDYSYNVDYKSGFSSNEKGNTNRLLMVGSIYHKNFKNNENMLFVRQKREDNNHYLQTIENSGYWKVYCADEAYTKISEFTGFDLKKWMDINMDWENDISNDFKNFLINGDMIKYLTW
ncbi:MULTISPECIES: hypothetical protein [Vagococcus]|uniref:Uncharacterized protein n=1 Tax=Vagococcus fluvialis bH819 TaxID=1255619 RepID=A0A1X6WMA0_9ENTE|nr:MULTISPECIES: hypothetical protein [Vagococcus]SLM85471.1 hypothetical protein FM121_05185 [Vagococcus fluvialis bH819]HCM89234.1 hypothetical protein [Vagococcus sp.]